MKQNEEQRRLFEEFPPVSTQEWEALINEDLKGADYERKLVWKTMEGFDVRPYYRKEDLEKISYLKVFPGDFPFVRSGRKKENNWFVRQDIRVGDINQANKKALDILMKGIDSLGWVLDEQKDPTIDEIEQLMENIYAQIVQVNFVCGKQAPKILDIYLALVKKYNRDLDKIHGSVDFDPIGRLLSTGGFYESEVADFDACAKIIEASSHVPHFRTLAVSAFVFKNAGSSIVEELAFGMAYGNEYLQRITEKGISIDDVAPNLKFHFGVSSNYFMEIAKIRAARLLWAKIVNAYGPSDAEFTRTHIHSITSDWNKTLYDPYVNMLRTTTEAMSAIIGGTNSLTVRPFDAIFGEPSGFSERIARNQQLLLKEESYLDKIVDPAAGSYYIETLTDSIAEQAWKIFLEVMDMGGFVAAFKKGFVQEKINKTAKSRDIAIASRREILVGTNQYPNYSEYLNKPVDQTVLEPTDHSIENPVAKPLKPYRGAQQLEKLRAATDNYSLSAKRPAAFMLTFGSLAMRRARSQFSGNFFGCAGISIIDNDGFKTVDAGVDAALKSEAEIVVICAADEDYPVIAPEIREKIGDKAIVVVAGYPKEVEELKAKGLRYFIHVKSNLLETLREFQQLLGIMA
ncbi:MAG: acyl-CoA mutase large subunit family protein [Bacteroidales bacterium]|nr:acyl-CoA mutase large subunit family protein [Bacteroidales bacterium]